MTKYSNPRLRATVENWPLGRHKRGTAVFWIQTDIRRGQRACRITTGAVKKLAYARKVRIVDGDDGRIYIIMLTKPGFIVVDRSDMRFSEEAIFPTIGYGDERSNDPRFAEVMALFDAEVPA
jgi:hypothetical protein